jgi:uncharacterized protein
MKEDIAEGELKETINADFRFSPRTNRAHEIKWEPWSEEAFARADVEEKPVLLSISAVWCHWCHVMDETSYSDGEVIELINRDYVPIRVDSDRNPDINSRYNQGGWPTTVFLNSEGTPLAGATYMPPETMRKVLARISELYTQNHGEIALPEHEIPVTDVREGEPDPGMVRETGEAILRGWDRLHGGLGDAPKFPQPETVALAMELYADEGKDDYLEFAGATLRSMIEGGLWDKVEGGFFRYSTTRDWSIPHYEKMLSDNAGLLSVLLKAYSLTGEDLFLKTAADTAAYIRRDLSEGERRFYGSQDADEEYYLLSMSERQGLVPPPVDRTVYSDLASRAAISFMEAGVVFRNEAYISQALASLEFLWEHSYREGKGMAHYNDGDPHRWGLLDDQVATAMAFTRAYGLTGDVIYLERAETLLDLVLQRHWNKATSELLDASEESLLPGLKPGPAEPAGQAAAAEALLYYGALSGEEKWRTAAGRILAGWTGITAAYAIMATPLARAINLYSRGPILVKISGGSEDTRRDFTKTSLLSPRPRVIPFVSKVGTIDEETTAEVCTMEACHLRTVEIGELAAHLDVKKDYWKLPEEVNDHEAGLSG